jgi:hypothetical protein
MSQDDTSQPALFLTDTTSGIDIGEVGDADAFERQWKHGTSSPCRQAAIL